jgi:hypothetical protein
VPIVTSASTRSSKTCIQPHKSGRLYNSLLKHTDKDRLYNSLLKHTDKDRLYNSLLKHTSFRRIMRMMHMSNTSNIKNLNRKNVFIFADEFLCLAMIVAYLATAKRCPFDTRLDSMCCCVPKLTCLAHLNESTRTLNLCLCLSNTHAHTHDLLKTHKTRTHFFFGHLTVSLSVGCHLRA